MSVTEVQTMKSTGKWHLIAGILMALTGIFIWFNPVAALITLALYIGIIFMIVGVGYFFASFSFRSGWYLLVGMLDFLVGLIFVTNLGVSVDSLPIIFAIWCLAVGVIQVAFAFQLKELGFSWEWSLGAGVLGILFAFLILAYPAVGAVTITFLMGSYILLYGLLQIGEYFYLKKA